MIKVQTNGMFSYYLEEPLAIQIKYHTEDDAGYIDEWTLKSNDFIIKGKDLEKLLYTLHWIIIKYDLGFNKSVHSKRKIVIYIDDISIIRGFLLLAITQDFKFYVEVMDFIEFRPMKIWNDTLHNVDEIFDYSKYMIENIFVKENYWYLTPNQRPRKILKNVCKDNNVTMAKDIFPEDWTKYIYTRKALFGGLYYYPYSEAIVEKPMIGLDLTSAYIYCLLIEEHCITPFEDVNTDNWEFYLDDNGWSSIGTYKIHYSCYRNAIKCYKDYYGNSFEKGDHEVIVVLNSVDLKLLLSLFDNVYSLECLELSAAKTGHLPKEIMDVIVDAYIDKNNAPKDTVEREMAKVVVNGIYGDSIRKIHSKEEYFNSKNSATLAPQWGIFTTSYCKKLVLDLALKVEGWYMSMTDSVYCLDTDISREALSNFNKTINQKVAEFCNQYGYDYTQLKGLGTFKVEAKIKKFKVFRYGMYLYTDVNDKMVLKASACNKKEVKVDDSLYDKTASQIIDETVDIPIYKINYNSTTSKSGQKSYGSLYQYNLKGKDAIEAINKAMEEE